MEKLALRLMLEHQILCWTVDTSGSANNPQRHYLSMLRRYGGERTMPGAMMVARSKSDLDYKSLASWSRHPLS
eukprot:1217891-Amphidinium_carterae.1